MVKDKDLTSKYKNTDKIYEDYCFKQLEVNLLLYKIVESLFCDIPSLKSFSLKFEYADYESSKNFWFTNINGFDEAVIMDYIYFEALDDDDKLELINKTKMDIEDIEKVASIIFSLPETFLLALSEYENINVFKIMRSLE